VNSSSKTALPVYDGKKLSSPSSKAVPVL
jgi:hypothetical protein